MPKLAESTTAVIVRGEKWEGVCASEPYEAGWAREAVLFLRLLAREGESGAALFRVQISPDGMRWVDEGATILVPEEPEQVTFAKSPTSPTGCGSRSICRRARWSSR
jgi:hypothetical protein